MTTQISMRVFLFLLVGFVALLPGCIPLSESYYRLEREGTTYFGSICNGNSGAPAVAYFPFEGIYLSASLFEAPKPGQIYLGVHVPDGHSAKLLQRHVTLVPSDRSAGEVQAPLQPTSNTPGNSDPHEFRATPSPYEREDYFQVLTGATATRSMWLSADVVGHKTYRFRAATALPDSGTMIFPALDIDGRALPGPRLPFRRRDRLSLIPINC